MNTGRKCVFFDRDGIVNKSPDEGGYVESWDEFELRPQFVDALRAVSDGGFEAVVVTNQRGVALGRMSREAVDTIHRNLKELLASRHCLHLLDILYCPHDRGVCECRKPQPGMLLEAARRHGIDLPSSWLIGDSESDVEAGRRAGCRTILVSKDAADSAADRCVSSMDELNGLLRQLLQGEGE